MIDRGLQWIDGRVIRLWGIGLLGATIGLSAWYEMNGQCTRFHAVYELMGFLR